MKRFLKRLALGFILALPWVGAASAQQVNLYCFIESSSPPKWTPCSAANPLQITGSLSIAGTTSNASSGVATSSTNLPTVSYNYGFNGTTWDQLQVDGSKNLKVNVVTGGGGSQTDQSAWTQGSTSFAPGGGVFNDAATLTSGQQGTLRLTTKRAAIVDVDTTGNALYSAITAPIPAGTNLIGKVGIDQTTPGTTNAVSATNFPSTVSVGTGAQGASSPRVTTATDTATIAGSAPGTAGTASANVVTVQGIASMTKLLVTPDSVALPANQSVNLSQVNGATTSVGNGASDTGTQRVVNAYATPATPIAVAASDNHAVLKNGAGIAMSVHTSNNSATKNYLRLYDAGTGFNGCNSATGVIFAMEIPPNDGGFSVSLGGGAGITFTNGLSWCITSGFGLTDTTNATASAIYANASYR